MFHSQKEQLHEKQKKQKHRLDFNSVCFLGSVNIWHSYYPLLQTHGKTFFLEFTINTNSTCGIA